VDVRARHSYILFGGTGETGGNQVHMVQFRDGGIELVQVLDAGKHFFDMVRAIAFVLFHQATHSTETTLIALRMGPH